MSVTNDIKSFVEKYHNSEYNTCHSYARFSKKTQSKGDSQRRQMALAEDYCQRYKLNLSDQPFTDRGKSGYSKKNKQQQLAEFLRGCEDGRVRAGDILFVENVDRLSRRGMEATRNLVSKILSYGVAIQSHSPDLFISHEDLDKDIAKVFQLAIDYYPEVITEKTWRAAQLSMNRNNRSAGRTTSGKHTGDWSNIFKGFLFHPVDDTTHMVWTIKYSRGPKKGTRERRYRSRHAFNSVPGASTETMDCDRFEEMFFQLLPELDLSPSKSHDPTEELKLSREYLQNEIKALDDLIEKLESKKRSVVATLEKRSEFDEQLAAVEKELHMTRETRVVPTKKFRKELAKMLRGSLDERALVRQRVQDIVQRVDLLPIRLRDQRHQPTVALVEIQFRNGEFVRAIELDSRLVKVSSKVSKPLHEQCKAGFRISADDYRKIVKKLS